MKFHITSVSFLCLLFLVFGGWLATAQGGVINHEDAHVEINRHNGCLNNSVEIGFLKGSVSCLDLTDVSDDQYNRMRLLHGFNEVVGYNSDQVVFAMFFCSSLIICALFVFSRRYA